MGYIDRVSVRVRLGLLILATAFGLAPACDGGGREGLCAVPPPTGDGERRVGAFELIPRELYVVHSGVSTPDGKSIRDTSNLFVLRGRDSAQGGAHVWIFGAGYGDPGGEFVSLAHGSYGTTWRDAAADVADVDRVVRECFDADPARVRIDFLTPHAHLDHINAEFFSELVAAGYSLDRIDIRVHAADLFQATCNEPCCGEGRCAGERDPYWANPFEPAWSEAQLARVAAIGSETDTCDDSVLEISAPTGTWTVRARPGHTPGSLNLDHVGLKLRLAGSLQPFCGEAEGRQALLIHGPVGPTALRLRKPHDRLPAPSSAPPTGRVLTDELRASSILSSALVWARRMMGQSPQELGAERARGIGEYQAFAPQIR